MKNSFVERLKTQTEEQPPQDEKFYSYEPQLNGRALMLELRTRDGKRQALPYSYMTKAGFDPETGIEVHVSDVTIVLKGRGLGEVFTYLVQNRLNWVREDFSGIDTGEEDVFVECIELKLRYEEQVA